MDLLKRTVPIIAALGVFALKSAMFLIKALLKTTLWTLVAFFKIAAAAKWTPTRLLYLAVGVAILAGALVIYCSP